MKTLCKSACVLAIAVIAVCAFGSPPRSDSGLIGVHFSRLFNGDRSLLAPSCFLFHGFPDGVFGTSFCYDTATQLSCETQLAKALKKHTANAGKGVAEALRYLAAHTFENDEQKPFLVITLTARVEYRQALSQEIGKLKPGSTDRLLALALLYYFSLGDYPEDVASCGKLIREEKDPAAAVVWKNLKAVTAKVQVTDTWQAGWKHPTLYR
jgi:hypothetical protein